MEVLVERRCFLDLAISLAVDSLRRICPDYGQSFLGEWSKLRRRLRPAETSL